MIDAVLLDNNDLVRILSEYFCVEDEAVIILNDGYLIKIREKNK